MHGDDTCTNTFTGLRDSKYILQFVLNSFTFHHLCNPNIVDPKALGCSAHIAEFRLQQISKITSPFPVFTRLLNETQAGSMKSKSSCPYKHFVEGRSRTTCVPIGPGVPGDTARSPKDVRKDKRGCDKWSCPQVNTRRLGRTKVPCPFTVR